MVFDDIIKCIWILILKLPQPQKIFDYNDRESCFIYEFCFFFFFRGYNQFKVKHPNYTRFMLTDTFADFEVYIKSLVTSILRSKAEQDVEPLIKIDKEFRISF